MAHVPTPSPRLREFLHQCSIGDLLKRSGGKNIVSVNSTDSLRSAINTLCSARLLSVPVKDEGEYIGFIDVLDILTFVLLTYSEGEDTTSMQWSDWCRNMDELIHRGVEFGSTPVAEVMNKSKVDKWCPLEDGTLFQLIEVFARGIHRAPIISKPGHIDGILSQSDIIYMLDKPVRDEGLLDEYLGNKTLSELGLARSEGIITMSANAQAILAFWVIYFNRVSAIAVVDHDGRLLGNLSASDIRGIGSSALRFSSLLLPIGDFLQLEGPDASKAAISCSPSTKFGEAVSMLAKNRIHRLWVVEDEKPVGLLSLTDIMKELTKMEPECL